MTRDLAKRLVEHPDDPARWLELARQLAAAPDTARQACVLVDESAAKLGVDTARHLLAELTGVPWPQLGRPFANYPDVDALPVHLGADSFHLRPSPSPDGARWLVASAGGWHIWTAGALEPAHTVDLGQARTAAATTCWVDDESIAVGHDTGWTVRRGDPNDTPPDAPVRFDHPIVGLLGPLIARGGGRHVVVVTTRRGVRDVFVVNVESRRPVALRNLSVAVSIEAAALHGTGFLCVGDGVQSSEVREVRLDGGWRTRMIHEAPLRGIAGIDTGRRAVTVDRAGRVVVWDGSSSRARPVDSGVSGESFGALVRRPVQCGYLSTRRELLVVHPDRRGLVFAPLDRESTAFVAGLQWLPTSLPSSSGWTPIGAEDGWLWVDLEARTMPEALRMPAALATDDELAALPGVSPQDVDALRRGEAPTAVTLRVRPASSVLDTLVGP